MDWYDGIDVIDVVLTLMSTYMMPRLLVKKVLQTHSNILIDSFMFGLQSVCSVGMVTVTLLAEWSTRNHFLRGCLAMEGDDESEVRLRLGWKINKPQRFTSSTSSSCSSLSIAIFTLSPLFSSLCSSFSL